jgi:quercetin dioxygenase-like cupin family protein
MTNSTPARVLAGLAVCAALASSAQAPAIKRTLLQKIDTADGKNEAVTAIAEIGAGGQSGRHSHPGTESGYVLEGSGVLEIDGQPPRDVKAGDSFAIPAQTVHNAKVAGSSPMKVISTYVVEKGKPLASPAK